jgi:CheY-like chemotaxis protein
MKLLYIDDDDIDRMAVSRLVRKIPDIEFTAVENLEQALPVIQEKGAVDVILSDFHLGIITLPEFAEKFDFIPFFVLTGKDKIEDEIQLRRLGMIGGFAKPVVQEQLQHILDWFNGDGDAAQEVEAEKYGQSYLEHLTQGDQAFRHILLKKLSEELVSVQEQLQKLAHQPDRQLLLLLVHQLKYKTTLIDAESTLKWCKDLEKRFRDEVSEGDIRTAISDLSTEVNSMQSFTSDLLG